MAYQWKKGGAPLSNTGNVSGATSASLTISSVAASDADDYTVDVSNLAGPAASSAAALTVYSASPATLTLVSLQDGNATISLTGVPGYQYAIEASTNPAPGSAWVRLQTDVAPFTFIDTSAGAFDARFYRAVLAP
jgi:hypothetical protein